MNMNGHANAFEEMMDETLPDDDDTIITDTPVETFKQPLDIGDPYAIVKDIARCPQRAKKRFNTFKKILFEIGHEKLIEDSEKENRKGETILHTVIKTFDFKNDVEKKVALILIEKFPKLLLQDRSNSEYAGQTPLHMAVCKGNVWLVGIMMNQLSKKEYETWKVTLLKGRAYGDIFRSTVMMGELPLTIAALTFDKGMFDLLLNEGAEIDARNGRQGDNVCHSLIRYGYLYPDKLDDVVEMCRKITEDTTPFDNSERAVRGRKLRKKIWLMENNDGLNPLQLATTHGLHQVFCLVMDLEAYCSENCQDGLFDIKVYDVTEIDAISSMPKDELVGVDTSMNTILTPENLSRRKLSEKAAPFKKSILMILMQLDPSVAFHFIMFPPIRRIINQKWRAYRKFFFPLWLFHFAFMCILTWYAVEGSQQSYNDANGTGFDRAAKPSFKRPIPKDGFITSYSIIAAVVGTLYLAQDILRIAKGKMPWNSSMFWNPYSNGWFRVLFIVFPLCLIVDLFPAIWSDRYEHYCLIFATLIGWFLVVFFLRAIRPFSFFTVLMQKVLIGDVFRFSVILALEILAFSTAMYMSLQGSDAILDGEYQDFGRIILSMFKLMVGLGDVANVYQARHPFICILIFAGFIIMTTLLMVNALIAMMGRTCVELIEDVGNVRSHDRHCKLQRLSVILFMESILPNSWIHKIGVKDRVHRYSNVADRRKKVQRYKLEIRSVLNDDEDDDNEEPAESSAGFRSLVIKALKSKSDEKPTRPLSGISDKLRNLFKKASRKSRQDPRDVAEDVQPNHFQVQPPVTQVFGMNPSAAEFGFNEGYSAPGHGTIDIYHINNCRNCSVSDIADEIHITNIPQER
ncbi:TRPV6-like protein [Mya arenaria]|uniref:TRPV6-like protein n=1 Tax=Mya arenaria TaxID=6604 RepID=A0ABY7GIL6_MYAAR|nr:transient receptor potential cation channel subfamily V member 5-like [Mya arenaria]WAR31031.1 TRPV6-like protein [Mya arenaria]